MSSGTKYPTGFYPTAMGMFLFGHLSGMAVLNGWIQARSGLSLEHFGFVLATGAAAALLVNLFLRRGKKTLSGVLGLLLLAFAVWLPVLAQTMPALLLAYSMQGAASRMALSGLYRAIADIQRRSLELDLNTNTTLLLESMAGLGLGESFLTNSTLTHWTKEGMWSASLSMVLGIAITAYLRGKLPAWGGGAGAAAAAKSGQAWSPMLTVAFAAYCSEVFTITQATAWSSILAKDLRFGDWQLSTLQSGGLVTGVFWVVVGVVRFTAGSTPGADLRKVVRWGSGLCVVAVLGAMLAGTQGVAILACYCLLGASIACFVPFALQVVASSARAGQYADAMALIGPVMSVAVHIVTGYFAGQREYVVLAVLTTTLVLAWRYREEKAA